MIDLHTHSNFSDGSDDPIALLKKAQDTGITCLSITDHDHCAAYDYLKNEPVGDYYKGTLIKGIELEALCLGIPIELLGYGIDTDKMTKGLGALYMPAKEKGLLEMKRLYENCLKIGMTFDPDVLARYEKSDAYYPTTYLHAEMTTRPENRRFVPDDASWAAESVFFRNYTANPSSPLCIDMRDLLPTAERVAGLIKDCGGLVFIPHIFQYGAASEGLLDYLLSHCDIDGIECYYPTFTKQETARLLAYAKEHQKYISAGSDYHGENRPGTKIGTGIDDNLCVGEEIIADWMQEVY